MRLVIFSVALASLASCVVPLRVTVYEPDCFEGNSASCVRQDDRLIIELPRGSKVNIKAYLSKVRQEANKTISMCVYVLLECGSTFQLLSSKIELQSNSWDLPRTARIREITGPPGPRSYAVDATIAGVACSTEIDKNTLQSTNTQQFRLWLESAHGFICETNIPVTTEFTLRMPDILVNGHKIQIAPVNFTAKKKWEGRGLCC